jgi:hypothetical protein
MELIRRSLTCVAIAVLLGGGLVVSPAHASTPDTTPTLSETSDPAGTESTAAAGILIYNQQTRRCLSGTGSGFIYTGDCRSGAARWHLVEPVPATGGNFIINDAYGYCLDINYAGNVYGLSCNSGFFQMWYWVWSVTEFRNAQTGLCLDSNDSGAVYTLGCNGGNYQNWGFA